MTNHMNTTNRDNIENGQGLLRGSAQKSDAELLDKNVEKSDPEVVPESGENQENNTEETTTTNDGQGEQELEQTFPRAYVEKLRKSEAGYREKAKDRDQLAERLHRALVAADGRLADPSDLPFDGEHLDNPEALAAAIADLVERKPGLRAQKFTGNAGAGKRGTSSTPPADLLTIMRNLK